MQYRMSLSLNALNLNQATAVKDPEVKLAQSVAERGICPGFLGVRASFLPVIPHLIKF
jgi:hypothetical protein